MASSKDLFCFGLNISLYLKKWSCALEEKAVKATHDCSHYNVNKENHGQNIYYTNDGEYVQKKGMNKVIYDAMYQWTMPAEYYNTKIEKPQFKAFNVTKYRNTAMLTFVNMAFEKNYEIGCNYEQCFDRKGNVTEAVVMCFYSKILTGGTDIYAIGDGKGCEYNPELCLQPRFCNGLLCRQ
ncbi:hypothetical protein TELCIR_05495 [Teladorsagia circumcincta]|uniref:SCP domain-containing protein n=1 Tax=Teladorsagia circumcincta TaxID=45464 RepID=A0A2G9US86_TELCI|nr:hypothetical protein TELCIR_05495 [Teladorsagia circumcincta]